MSDPIRERSYPEGPPPAGMEKLLVTLADHVHAHVGPDDGFAIFIFKNDPGATGSRLYHITNAASTESLVRGLREWVRRMAS